MCSMRKIPAMFSCIFFYCIGYVCGLDILGHTIGGGDSWFTGDDLHSHSYIFYNPKTTKKCGSYRTMSDRDTMLSLKCKKPT